MEVANHQVNIPFTFSGRLRSIRYAFRGIALMLRTQHNAWVHLLASIIAIVMGIILHLTSNQWALIIFAIITVWIAEALNTAFELLCDVASPNFHPTVKQAKDVSAGAVLISALGAMAIGCMVFIPQMIQALSS